MYICTIKRQFYFPSISFYRLFFLSIFYLFIISSLFLSLCNVASSHRASHKRHGISHERERYYGFKRAWCIVGRYSRTHFITALIYNILYDFSRIYPTDSHSDGDHRNGTFPYRGPMVGVCRCQLKSKTPKLSCIRSFRTEVNTWGWRR